MMKRMLIVAAAAAMLSVSCGEDDGVVKIPGGGKIGKTVNREFTHIYMNSHYLWNDAYRQTKKDFSKEYDDYLEDVLRQMNEKGENLKDGFRYGDTWYFYSYIDRVSVSRSGQTRAGKTQERGLGMDIGLAYIDRQKGTMCAFILYVYPDSPAAAAGLTRGDIISKINGVQLTFNNYQNYIGDLYLPMSYDKTLTLTMYKSSTSSDTVTVKSGLYYPTPVIYAAVIEVKGHRVGYLVYNAFDNAYDDELKDVLSKLKNENITDIVLDLRYNGGGSVATSLMLTSALAGEECRGKTFMYYRYNKERMASYGSNWQNWYKNLFDAGVAAEYGFDFNKVYVIGSSSTASASELVINALRGIDKPVTLLASENTNGKDVGMEVQRQTIEGYTYEFAPITFQSYNAKGESDYDDGFAPDIFCSDDYMTPGLIVDWGMFYYYTSESNYGEVAKRDYLIDALEDIVGGSFMIDDVKGKKIDLKSAHSSSGLNRIRVMPEDSMPERLPLTGVEGEPLRRNGDFRRNGMYVMADTALE